jgi:hypothetical protein
MAGHFREAVTLAVGDLGAEVLGQMPQYPEPSIWFDEVARVIGRTDIFVGVMTDEVSDLFRVEYAAALGLGAPTFLFLEDIPGLREAQDLLIFTRFARFRNASDLRVQAREIIGRFISEVRRAKEERRLLAGERPAALGPPRAERKALAITSPPPSLFDPKRILVIGQDSIKTSMAKLRRIAAVVQSLGYEPLLLKDVPDHPSLTIERKFLSVASHSFLVLAEDTEPSGHLDETKVCEMNGIVTAFVRESGHGSTWMQAHFPLLHRFMALFCYKAPRSRPDTVCPRVYPKLGTAVRASVKWAESYYSWLRPRLQQSYRKL